MAIGSNDARKLAAQVVQSALAGGALTLKGPTGKVTAGAGATEGQIDAAYLKALIAGLAEVFTE